MVWSGGIIGYWPRHPASFGVKVEHGGVKMVVAENNLQVANESTVVQGVRGERVAWNQAEPYFYRVDYP